MHRRLPALTGGLAWAVTAVLCLAADVAEPVLRVVQSGAGDFQGVDETPILQAIERLGEAGGTVEIGPGEYVIRRHIMLPSGIALRGTDKSVLRLPSPTRVREAAAKGQDFLLVDDSQDFRSDTQVQLVVPTKDGDKNKPSKHPKLALKQVLPGKLVFAEPIPCDVPAGSGVGYSHNLFEVRGSKQNICIEGLTLDGGRVANLKMPAHVERCAILAHGLYSYGDGPSAPPIENIEVRNCRIRNFYGRAVAYYSVVRGQVTGCTIEDIADESIDLDHFCYHCNVANNLVRRGTTGVTINDGSYCTVADNRIEGCGVGVTIWWWYMCPQTDIDVENAIRGNTILGSRGPAISLGKRCFRNRIEGNHVEGEIRSVEPDNIIENNDRIETKKLGDRSFRARLLFDDPFDDLSNWLAETDGTVETADNQLVWNCPDKKAGTIWCRQRFEGPTIVEYDVVTVSGSDNVNFIFYASHPDGLLETTGQRTGKYSEYHQFPNYIITYLTNFEPKWRIRFRKNPGFQLLSEAMSDRPVTQGVRQRVSYAFEADGTMSLYADGQLLHTYRDTDSPYRSGYHGFRTWNSALRYSDFKVFAIVGD